VKEKCTREREKIECHLTRKPLKASMYLRIRIADREKHITEHSEQAPRQERGRSGTPGNRAKVTISIGEQANRALGALLAVGRVDREVVFLSDAILLDIQARHQRPTLGEYVIFGE
jgi:hypothetical protein